MHKFYRKKYYFISEYDTNLIDNLDKSVNIIYRNYQNKIDIQQIQKLGNYCKKKGIKLYLSNNIKLANQLDLDGAYIPAFNKNTKHLAFSFKKKFGKNYKYILYSHYHTIRNLRIKADRDVFTQIRS